MKKVTITQFKDNLSALLARAARGEEVIIFDRKRPFVRVVALFRGDESSNQNKSVDTRLAQLEADGAISRRKRNSLTSLLERPRASSSASVIQAAIEERDREL
jgi:antitoxin (DNA-binding transcriptional repressor) of toxin-antitoxin stability system